MVVKLTAWSTGNDVFCNKPHPNPFLERWSGSLLSVGTFTVTVLGSKDFHLKVFLDFLQLSGRLGCVSLCWDRGGLFALPDVELPLGVITLVPEEGRYACRFRCLFVCREFREW